MIFAIFWHVSFEVMWQAPYPLKSCDGYGHGLIFIPVQATDGGRVHSLVDQFWSICDRSWPRHSAYSRNVLTTSISPPPNQNKRQFESRREERVQHNPLEIYERLKSSNTSWYLCLHRVLIFLTFSAKIDCTCVEKVSFLYGHALLQPRPELPRPRCGRSRDCLKRKESPWSCWRESIPKWVSLRWNTVIASSTLPYFAISSLFTSRSSSKMPEWSRTCWRSVTTWSQRLKVRVRYGTGCGLHTVLVPCGCREIYSSHNI